MSSISPCITWLVLPILDALNLLLHSMYSPTLTGKRNATPISESTLYANSSCCEKGTQVTCLEVEMSNHCSNGHIHAMDASFYFPLVFTFNFLLPTFHWYFPAISVSWHQASTNRINFAAFNYSISNCFPALFIGWH